MANLVRISSYLNRLCLSRCSSAVTTMMGSTRITSHFNSNNSNNSNTNSHHHQMQARQIHQSTLRLAGHAKWQNIAHTKAKGDRNKSVVFNRLIYKIQVALRSAGGADPNLNRDLEKVLKECRANNMPSATIDRAIKRCLNKKLYDVRVELIGPEQTLMVVDGQVENRGALKNDLRKILKKYVGFGFAEEGRALYAFETKGVVRVKNVDGSAEFDQEAAEEVAIEADAEDVRPAPDDESVLMFIGDEHSHVKVRAYLEANLADKYTVVESGTELVPFVTLEVSEKTYADYQEIIELVNEIDGVSQVYTNI